MRYQLAGNKILAKENDRIKKKNSKRFHRTYTVGSYTYNRRGRWHKNSRDLVAVGEADSRGGAVKEVDLFKLHSLQI